MFIVIFHTKWNASCIPCRLCIPQSGNNNFFYIVIMQFDINIIITPALINSTKHKKIYLSRHLMFITLFIYILSCLILICDSAHIVPHAPLSFSLMQWIIQNVNMSRSGESKPELKPDEKLGHSPKTIWVYNRNFVHISSANPQSCLIVGISLVAFFLKWICA